MFHVPITSSFLCLFLLLCAPDARCFIYQKFGLFCILLLASCVRVSASVRNMIWCDFFFTSSFCLWGNQQKQTIWIHRFHWIKGKDRFTVCVFVCIVYLLNAMLIIFLVCMAHLYIIFRVYADWAHTYRWWPQGYKNTEMKRFCLLIDLRIMCCFVFLFFIFQFLFQFVYVTNNVIIFMGMNV